ncbi:MAG: hypothetical protein EAZ32_12295 [Cytophagia bacterium]|nr:MAG: hypothetical protein EAZ46_11745 [Runella sp.]TAG19202.1 MAG: hypothetical protein EAZ38_12935 [Cytophagales bacterium]TAG38469.1 MAG: hypothetical protein EAZ32_12295 [Cytophagia bacterium]TAG55961.1 MAG: hypothetical protein EAZ29_03420 [Runella slithyformis]TAG60139.1 MAG: hypothetical protein EAZ26_14105 [Runella slithyformis]
MPNIFLKNPLIVLAGFLGLVRKNDWQKFQIPDIQHGDSFPSKVRFRKNSPKKRHKFLEKGYLGRKSKILLNLVAAFTFKNESEN